MTTMLLIVLAGLLAYAIKLAFKFSDRVEFGNELTYDQALKTGVFDSMVNIQYDDKIYDDRALKGRMLYLIDMMSSTEAKTTIQKAFDRVQIKDYFNLASGFTSSSTAGEAVTLTLAANMKDNVLVSQILELGYTPASGYTNIVQVSSKTTGYNTTITVVPVDPAHKVGSGSGLTVPSGTLVSVLATAFAQYSGSVEPISAQPRPITNYVQMMKFPYAYDDLAAKENLYVKGNIKNMLDSTAKDLIIAYGEKMLLSESAGYHKATARLGASNDDVNIGVMRGLIHWVKYGDTQYNLVSPAVKSYSTFTYDVFDQWQWTLFDPELDEVGDVRLLVCNKAMRKTFTDLKNQRLFVQSIEPNDTYGIKGVKTIQTDAGSFDMLVHPKIHKRYPDIDKPMGIALTLPMIEYKPMIKPMLAANIQNPDITGKKSEYRWAFTYMLHNAGTAYHGILYPL